MKQIRVMVAFPYRLIARALSCLLENTSELQLLPEAAGREELLRCLPQHAPDVLLLDMELFSQHGPRLLDQIRRECPFVQVAVLSGQDHRAAVQQVMDAGAAGYLHKDAHEKELAKAIRILSQGGVYFCPGTLEMLVKATYAQADREGPPASGHLSLSSREREVLHLISLGYTNAQIAQALFISPRTAGTHRTNLLKKTGTKNTAELVRYAMELGEGAGASGSR